MNRGGALPLSDKPSVENAPIVVHYLRREAEEELQREGEQERQHPSDVP
jgi:hypothetical protein